MDFKNLYLIAFMWEKGKLKHVLKFDAQKSLS